MAVTQQIYHYSFEMNYVLNNTDYELSQDLIKYVVIDYDYDKTNMPIIYMSLALTKKVFDMMEDNTDKGYISLKIRKKQANATNPLWVNCTEGQFTYFILSDSEETKLDGGVGDKNPYGGDEFKTMEIALLKTDIINKTKKEYNTVLNNITLMDAVHYGTYHLPMIIEPVNQGSYRNLLIPPINTTAKYLQYINSIQELYDTPYKFFVDFNRGYLLSSSGKPIPAKGDLANSIIITEDTMETVRNKFSGQEYDSEQKCYNIRVSERDVKETRNNITNKSMNKVVGISTSGATTTSSLKTFEDKFSTEKTTFVRVNNENMRSIQNKTKNIENQSFYVTFAKGEIDASIFTPNMEYNYKSLDVPEYDGKYLLCKKQEIFKQTDSEFVADVVVTLKKIMS